MKCRLIVAVSMLILMSVDIVAQQDVKIGKNEFRTDKPGFDAAWKSVGRADDLYSEGVLSYPLAIPDYSQALVYNSENAELNYKMGVCKLFSPKRDEALAYLLKAYRNRPDVAVDILFLLGRAYQFSGQYIEAVGKYTEYLEADLKKNTATMESVRKYIDECNSAMIIMADTVRVSITNPGDAVNSPYDDYSPVLNRDATKLYIASRRPVGRKTSGVYADGFADENIFLSTISDGKWSFAMPLEGKLNTGYCEAPLALSPNGAQLYIYNGYKGEGDILVSTIKGGSWRSPVPLKPNINSPAAETSISVSSSGNEIFFVSERNKGVGGKDIYSTSRTNRNKWSKPVNLSLLNSPEDEESVSVSRGGDTLWFSSRGHSTIGGFDIFFSVRQGDETWSQPVNAGYPINTVYDDLYYTQSGISDSVFMLVSNRPGGLGGLDIYVGRILPPEPVQLVEPEPVEIPEIIEAVIPVPEPVRVTDTVIIIKEVIREVPVVAPVPEFFLAGKVRDSETDAGLVARIDIIDPDTYQLAASIITLEGDGSFNVNVKNKKSYMIEIRSNGYLSDMRKLEIPASYTGNMFYTTLHLNKIVVGKKVVLNNIFFQTGKAVLTPASFAEIDKLAGMMNENPEMKIEISGHTDNTGSEAVNTRLSLERARAVAAYLASKGVAAARVDAKGYGSAQPVEPNTTEQGRAINRRVEFKILEL
jgi:outer membrane protein OmpA-like peptidoglycan-associated protein